MRTLGDREFMVPLPNADKIDMFELLNASYNTNVSSMLLHSVRVINTEKHVSNLRQRLSMYSAKLMFTTNTDVVYCAWLAALPVKIHVGDNVRAVDVTVNGDAFAASLLLEGVLGIRLYYGDDVTISVLNVPSGYEVYVLGTLRAKEKKKEGANGTG